MVNLYKEEKNDQALQVFSVFTLQLDEDVRVLVQRFDAETADEDENKSMKFSICLFFCQKKHD